VVELKARVAAHADAPFTFVTDGVAPLLLDGPILVVESARVTHLRYTVRRS
jgi:hypothetical protein